jgi:type VI secretion system protein ImpF
MTVSRDDHTSRLIPSLLERLVDPRSAGDRRTPSEALREMKGIVRRDLETLLNTRNAFDDLPGTFVEANQSILTYGLPDLSTFAVASVQDQHQLRRAVEAAIARFEPRLGGVSVTVVTGSTGPRSLSLRVNARLLVDPAPEPVSFEVVMPRGTLACEVHEDA